MSINLDYYTRIKIGWVKYQNIVSKLLHKVTEIVRYYGDVIERHKEFYKIYNKISKTTFKHSCH